MNSVDSCFTFKILDNGSTCVKSIVDDDDEDNDERRDDWNRFDGLPPGPDDGGCNA